MRHAPRERERERERETDRQTDRQSLSATCGAADARQGEEVRHAHAAQGGVERFARTGRKVKREALALFGRTARARRLFTITTWRTVRA